MDRWTASARSLTSPATSPIAAQGKACAQNFHQLCTLLEDTERQDIYGISYLQASECSGQFRIWAGNIGALQTVQSASSLDYRLREVPKVSKQVLSLLEDLKEALADVIAIASGERENRVSSPVPFNSEFLDDEGASWSETVSGGLEPASGPTSEIQELFQSIPETITSLFKLSILIRNSSSRDRYAKALSSASKAPFNEQFDIDHVGNKFPRLYRDDREWLRQRLGKAITQKRQYLRYYREHREKLSKLPETSNTTEALSEPKIGSTYLAVQGQQSEVVSDAQTVVSRPTSTLAPTTASTVVPAKFDHLEKLEEQNEDDNRSQTSYATSVNEDENDNRLSVVRLEEIAGNTQSFECPYRWTIQRINNQHAWRKHVMRDLKPYVCTWEECDMKLFPDRYTWFTHELRNHLFDKHVRKSHANKFTNDQLPALVRACQKPVDKLPATACPFCDDWEARLRELNQHLSADEILVVTPQQFRQHVGSHMEQLALFAIPRGYEKDGDADSGGAVPGHGSSSSSDRSLVRPDYEDEDNPRLHIAAFQGLREEVKAFLDGAIYQKIRIVPPILLNEGSTWGSALSAAAAGGHVDIAYLCMPREPSGTIPSYYLDSLPRSKSKGWGPLHWAASNGHLAMSSFLTGNGMSVRDRALDGSTAADLARRHGHEDIVQCLELVLQESLNAKQDLKDPNEEQIQYDLRLTVIAAKGLVKRDIFSPPDPYAIAKLNGIEVASTAVIKRTLDPHWNEIFKLSVTEQSRIEVKIYDEKKQKKANEKENGYLGRVRFMVREVIYISAVSGEPITRDQKTAMQLIDGKGYLTLYLYMPPPHSLLATDPVSLLSPRPSSAILLSPSRKPVFGKDLDELFKRDGPVVPLIVYQCIVAVDIFGIFSKDIYRLSGTQSNVNKMRDIFDTDASKVDFKDPANFFHDVNSVAALLKLFFRELPDSLMTGKFYEEFIEAARVEDDIDRRNSIHGIVNRLPDPNYATLRALVLHLNRVAEALSKNLMKARDLAIIFAPTILGPKGGLLVNEDIGLRVRVVDTIISNALQIFDDDDD